MDNSEIVCKKCGNTSNVNTVIVENIVLPNGGYHIKASCPVCGKYIKFLPHSQSGVKDA